MINKEDRLFRKEEKVRKKALLSQRTRIYNEMVAYQRKHSKEKKYAPADSFISLQHINKIYDNKVQAVYDFNIDIKKHEFIVFVGPSGCGKSTTLRMIAGLEQITAGDLYIDGIYANELEPKNRNIAMVFQSYALYPHMSVKDNLAFSLKIRKVPTLQYDKEGKPLLAINKGLIKDFQKEKKNLIEYKASLTEEEQGQVEKIDAEIAELDEKIEYLKVTPVHVYKNKHISKAEINERVQKAAEILQITEYLDRKPKALSGGQCQRVALGRAIVRNAKLFLMDEPLSNLDAKLRVQMRSEIINLHNRLNATTIYVTHDQTEAMTMATRIVIMNKGVIQQIGTPRDIYNHPSNVFVATFIGSPSMNLYDVKYQNGHVIFEDGDNIALDKETQQMIEAFYKEQLESAQKELETLLNKFEERNVLLEKIKLAQEAGKNEEVTQLEERLTYVEKSNERLGYLQDAIARYSEFIEKKEYDVIFGIRPEDIHDANTASHQYDYNYLIDSEVVVAELLGHEYFIHTNFNHKDLISKIRSVNVLAKGDKIKLLLDLSKAHIFDRVSQKTIK